MLYIDKLMINGFRNYHHQQLNFNPRLNIVTGANGQGKTNILESIYFLSVNRSFRTSRDQELANWEDNAFILKGTFYNDEFKSDVLISYSRNKPLKVKINEDEVERYAHLQEFPVVVFSPDDLLLIREGPSIRRRFLNLEASRLSPLYFKDLRSYQRVLKQRNHLLKGLYGKQGNKTNDLLEPWDQALVELGSKIIHSRVKIVNDLEQEAERFYTWMTTSKETISLEYATTISYSEDTTETEKVFRQDLLGKREIELKRGLTAVGPHLDDLKILTNGYETRKYSSQGQKRTAALALKMAEVSLFQKKLNKRPIILLDDVFSEFDSQRKNHLLDFINTNKGQCFITTAVGLDGLMEYFGSDHKIISVSQGRASDEKGRPDYRKNTSQL